MDYRACVRILSYVGILDSYCRCDGGFAFGVLLGKCRIEDGNIVYEVVRAIPLRILVKPTKDDKIEVDADLTQWKAVAGHYTDIQKEQIVLGWYYSCEGEIHARVVDSINRMYLNCFRKGHNTRELGNLVIHVNPAMLEESYPVRVMRASWIGSGTKSFYMDIPSVLVNSQTDINVARTPTKEEHVKAARNIMYQLRDDKDRDNLVKIVSTLETYIGGNCITGKVKENDTQYALMMKYLSQLYSIYTSALSSIKT